MNLDYPNLNYPFGPVESFFPDSAAAERSRRAKLPLRSSPLPIYPGDWHYLAVAPRRRVPWTALAFSAAMHAGILFGFTHHTRSHAVIAEDTTIQVVLMEMPKLEDPDDRPDDPGKNSEAPIGVDAPSLPDVRINVNLET